jgi:hypothetical protein
MDNTGNCKTHDEGETQCNLLAKDGHLASVHSAAQNAILTDLLNDAALDTAWIGGKKKPDGTWLTWTDGTPFDWGTTLYEFPWQVRRIS